MAERASQNFDVSATGGAGTSGQGAKYIPGMNQFGSSGKETMEQQGIKRSHQKRTNKVSKGVEKQHKTQANIKNCKAIKSRFHNTNL
jgi:hypothetical protein